LFAGFLQIQRLKNTPLPPATSQNLALIGRSSHRAQSGSRLRTVINAETLADKRYTIFVMRTNGSGA